jgi:hypothetical protein
MDGNLVLSAEARSTAGVLLLTIVLVEWGGLYMLRIVRGRHPVTAFQQAFSRAGHAHAGVLVSLSLIAQLFADAAHASGLLAVPARTAVPLAAVLMPVGFFLSSAGRGATKPNSFVWLLYAGAVSLGIGVASLGLALLTAS